MSKTTFTPGPWVISPASTGSATWDEIYSSDMEKEVCGISLSKQVAPAMNPDGSNVLTDAPEREEAESNARLIAAAPEMYKAMEEFCNRVDKGEVRSTKTYNKFKSLLNRINNGQ